MKFQDSTLNVQSFKEMALTPQLLETLNKQNISKPTAIQSQAIPAALAGSDLVAIAQTGSGKTLAFALSVLTKLNNKPGSRALVLVSSREMAQQIYKVSIDLCKGLPVTACLIIGGQAGVNQDKQLKRNPRLIIATPGRMNDHLLNNKLLLQGVQMVVLDEADRMLDMGFAPQLQAIQKTMRGTWQTLMFSASFSKQVEGIAQLLMKEPVVMIRTEASEAPVESLRQKVLFLDAKMKQAQLLEELKVVRDGMMTFTESRESSEEVGELLKSRGYPADFVHGELTQGHRNRVVREFREGKIRILVTTDLLARGIDVSHVDCVVNYELPYKSEDFLHRIGRTARAGRNGFAITFITPGDVRTYRKIKPYLTGADEIQLDPRFKFIEQNPKRK